MKTPQRKTLLNVLGSVVALLSLIGMGVMLIPPRSLCGEGENYLYSVPRASVITMVVYLYTVIALTSASIISLSLFLFIDSFSSSESGLVRHPLKRLWGSLAVVIREFFSAPTHYIFYSESSVEIDLIAVLSMISGGFILILFLHNMEVGLTLLALFAYTLLYLIVALFWTPRFWWRAVGVEVGVGAWQWLVVLAGFPVFLFLLHVAGPAPIHLEVPVALCLAISLHTLAAMLFSPDGAPRGWAEAHATLYAALTLCTVASLAVNAALLCWAPQALALGW